MNDVTLISLASGGARLIYDGDDASGWPAPLPLPSNLPPVLPFDLQLLPETLRPWVQDTAERMQCPPEFPGTTAMIALGSIIGRKIAIRPKQRNDWQETPNFWGMVIGRPGLLKSPAISQGLEPLNTLDTAALEKHKQELSTFRVTAILAEEKSRQARKKISAALADNNEAMARTEAEVVASEAPDPPKRRRYKINDSTIEKLAELLKDNPNGVLLHRDELTGFLRSLDKEGREDSRAFFLEAWNGTGDFTSDRIGRGTIRVEALTVSIIGAIQPGPLSTYLRQAVKSGLGDDGLLQRFQFAVWPDITTEWKNVDRWPDTAAKQEAFAVFKYLDDLTPDAIGADRTEKIPFLRFAPDAQGAFDTWHQELETRLRSDSEHPAFEAHLAKYRKLVPALALSIHLADRQSGPVSLPALQKALLWATYLESHAGRIYASVRRPDEAAARELAKHLRSGDLNPSFLVREVYRKGWTGLDTKEDVEAALEVLCEKNWVRPAVPLAAPAEGRPEGPRYEINPRVQSTAKRTTAKSDKTPTNSVSAVLSPPLALEKESFQ